MIVERTQEGKTIARQREDYREGRPKKYGKKQIRHALDLLESHSYKQVEEITGISKSTLIRARKELEVKEWRDRHINIEEIQSWKKKNLSNKNGEVYSIGKYFKWLEDMNMRELQESEAFCVGVAFGLDLYQQKVIAAHERGQSLLINEELYYIQSGRERLQEAIDKICQ